MLFTLIMLCNQLGEKIFISMCLFTKEKTQTVVQLIRNFHLKFDLDCYVLNKHE